MKKSQFWDVTAPRVLSTYAILVFVLLWVGFVIALVVNPEWLSLFWNWVRELPIVAEIIIWILFLPILVGLWTWESSWPALVNLLVLAGITTPESLTAKRPYIIVGAFVLGMLLTPPDIISQTLLALPMWLLFEAGVIFSRVLIRRREQDKAEQGLSDDEMEDELDKAIAEEERLNQEKSD